MIKSNPARYQEDLTYGRKREEGKKRRYQNTLKLMAGCLFKKTPIKVITIEDQEHSLYITSVNQPDNNSKKRRWSITLCPTPYKDTVNRKKIALDTIITIEHITKEQIIQNFISGGIMNKDKIEESGYKPSNREFITISSSAYHNNKRVRVYLADARTLEGIVKGFNEDAITILQQQGTVTECFADWIDRIIILE